MKMPAFGAKTETWCASELAPIDLSKQMFLVGDVFMRKFYTIFDREHDRVGLARASANPVMAKSYLGQKK